MQTKKCCYYVLAVVADLKYSLESFERENTFVKLFKRHSRGLYPWENNCWTTLTFWYYFKFFTVLASTNIELFIKIIVVYSLKGSWKAGAWFVIDGWQLHRCQCVSCWLSIFNCSAEATGQLVQFKPFWVQFVDFSVEESYEYTNVACKSY